MLELLAQMVSALLQSTTRKKTEFLSKAQKVAGTVKNSTIRAATVAAEITANKAHEVAAGVVSEPRARASRDAVDNAWKVVRKATYQTGNCAQWTSEGDLRVV